MTDSANPRRRTATQPIHDQLMAADNKRAGQSASPSARSKSTAEEHGGGIRCRNCGTIEHHYRDAGGALWLWCNACKHRWRWHSDTPDALFKPRVADTHIRDVVVHFTDMTPAEWQDRAPPKAKPEPLRPTLRDVLVAQQPTGTTPLFEKKPWEGVLTKKPWEHKATAVIPHRNTPELLELCIRFLERQTEQPYIMVIDTGSDEVSLQRVLTLRSEFVEVHQVACHATEEYADVVCYAMDLGMSACRTEYLWCLHSDCFVVNVNMLAELLAKSDGGKVPVIGYESSSANRFDECKGMVSHTCTLLHMPTMRRLDVTWSRAGLAERARHAGQAVIFDPEMSLNYRLRERGIKPLILGAEQAGGTERDANRVHLRSATLAADVLATSPRSRPSAHHVAVLAELRALAGENAIVSSLPKPLAR